MTKRQYKICKCVVRFKRLDIILAKTKIGDYIDLQDAIGAKNLDFSDDNMDKNTEVTL